MTAFFHKALPAITVIVLACAFAVCALAEQAAPPAGKAAPVPEEFEGLDKKLEAFAERREGYVETISRDRNAFANFLESLGYNDWARPHRLRTQEFLAQISETPRPTLPERPIPEALPAPSTPPLKPLALQKSVADNAPDENALTLSIVLWAALAALWLTALVLVGALKNRAKGRRVLWLLLLPTAAVIVTAVGLLAPRIYGKEFVPVFFAPGSLLLLVLVYLAYAFAGLLARRKWITAASIAAAALAGYFGFVCLIFPAATIAATDKIGGIRISGPIRFDETGSIFIEKISSAHDTRVPWELSDLRVNSDLLAIMWGRLSGVVVSVGEVDVTINPERLKQPSPPDSEPMDIEKLARRARALTSLSVGRITVRLVRKDKDDMTLFEGSTRLAQAADGEMAGVLTGRVVSAGDLVVNWRADLDAMRLKTQYDLSGFSIDAEMISGFLPDDLNLKEKGWDFELGLSVAGDAGIAKGGKADWNTRLGLSAGKFQLPGLPLPLVRIGGEILLNPNGVRLRKIQGGFGDAHDNEMKMAINGAIGWDGDGDLDVVSVAFPLRSDWIAWVLGPQEWLDGLDLTGTVDIHSTLELSFKDGSFRVANIKTRLFPGRLYLRHVETGLDVGLNFASVVAGGDGSVEVVVGDAALAGGKICGAAKIDPSGKVTFPSGWLALTGADLYRIMGKEQSAASLGGRLNVNLFVPPGRNPQDKPAQGCVWIQDVKLEILPIVSDIIQLMEISLPKDDNLCSVYAEVDIQEKGIRLKDFKLSSRSLKLHGEGVVGYDGKLTDVAITVSTNKSLLEIIPILGKKFKKLGMGKDLEKIFSDTTRGLLRFRVIGTVDDYKIIPAPLGNVAGRIVDFLRPKKEKQPTE